MEITFVIPYVNGDDPIWRKAFEKAGGVYDDSMLHGWPRYKDNGTLELCIKSIEKYAPWGKIILIVAMPSQVPGWVKDKDIKVIYHSDFLPRKYKPYVFQSNAIETFIGRMNLPEYFVWMNDDLAFTRPITPNQLFDESGNPLYNLWFEDSSKHFWSKGWNISNYQLLFPGCTDPKVIKTLHGPTPMRMSWCEEMYKKYKKRMFDTIGSVVERESGQVNQLSYSLYSHIYKCIKPSPLRGVSVIKTTFYPKNFFDSIDWVCINENSNNGFDTSKPISLLKQHLANN